MKALFVDGDPVVRGVFHCMATMAGLDHAIVSTADEALRLLRGEDVIASDGYHIRSAMPGEYAAVVTELDLPDMAGDAFARAVRALNPGAMVFAHTHPEQVTGGEAFERMFFKPDACDAVIRAVLGVLGKRPELDLFDAMVPELTAPAA